jgi:hypothetical protein
MMGEEESDESGFEDASGAEQKLTLDDISPIRPPTTPTLSCQDRPLQPFIPLSGFTHSLVPDMYFGWRPKLVHGGPIPLLFNKCELPVALNPLTNEDFPVLFHGFRPRDTVAMHQAFAGKDSYPMPVVPAMDVYEFLHRNDQKLKDSRLFVGMNPEIRHELVFDSCFESGNLDKVVQIAEWEYDLYMRADANTRGYHQWYFFSVRNTQATQVKFNILNFTKNESLYSQGMLPVVYSEKEAGKGWQRAGFDVKYRASKLNLLLGDRRTYYSLTFTYKFQHSGDKVYFAYAFPYTFTRLLNVMKELGTDRDDIVKQEVLCKSLSGVEVPLLTITDFSLQKEKSRVLIIGRAHPGETHGSWMMEVSGYLGRFTLFNGRYAGSQGAPHSANLHNCALFKPGWSHYGELQDWVLRA